MRATVQRTVALLTSSRTFISSGSGRRRGLPGLVAARGRLRLLTRRVKAVDRERPAPCPRNRSRRNSRNCGGYLLFPLRPRSGGLPGSSFGLRSRSLRSALPVRLPAGNVVSVGVAPMLPRLHSGWPAGGRRSSAAIGTTDAREVRGEVPWYGTLYNHASAIISAVAAGIAFDVFC